MLKGTEKVQFQPFNPRNAFICLPFQFCLRQQNVNKKSEKVLERVEYGE